MDLLIIIIGIGIIYILDTAVNKIEQKNLDKDLKYRQQDSELAKYYNEMNTDRNDGWTKLHYRNLYTHRLNKLKNK